MEMKAKAGIFLIAILSILSFSWICAVYWVTGDISFPGDKNDVNLNKNDNYTITLKDLNVLDKDAYVSMSEDSYIVVNFEEPTRIGNIVFDIVLDVESSPCQIFFASEDEDFTREKSAYQEIFTGENYIQIEQGMYSKIRLDFVNTTGVTFVINSVSFCESFIPNDVIFIFVGLALVLTVIASMFIFCKNRFCVKIFSIWKNLPVRSRNMFILMLMVLVSSAVVILKLWYSDKIFAYDDIGSDTFMQYLPQYNLIVNKIKDGTIGFWLPEVGYGYNLAYFFIFNPFILLVFLGGTILGTGALPSLIIIYKLATTILCAYFAFRFLEWFSGNYNLIVIGAYLYTFNGFAIVWGQHYVFFDYPLYAILVFYIVESYLRKRYMRFNFRLILVSFACMLFSVYMSYMIYVPVAIYAIIRYIQLYQVKLKEFFISMLHFALNIAIGFIGGLLTGLLYMNNILNSGRVDSETSALMEFLTNLKASYLEDDFLGSLQRFLSANLSGIGTEHEGLHNYYEEPQLFFSALFIILLFQFVFTIHKTSPGRKQLICKWIAVILVGFALYNKGILVALYAFSQINRRSTFALLPLFSIMVVVVLDNIFEKKILSKTGLLLGSTITLFLLLYNWSDFMNIDKQIVVSVSALTVIIGSIIFWIVSKKNRRRIQYYMILLLGLMISLNVVTESYVSTIREGLVDESNVEWNEIRKRTQDALDYINEIDTTYYRTEKTYMTWNGQTDSFYEGYYPITTYNSILSWNTKEYNNEFMNPAYVAIRWYKPSFLYAQNNIIQHSELGLKYILSEYEQLNYGYYQLLEQVDGIYIYQNLETNSFTTFFDDVVLKSDFMRLGYIDRTKIQQKALVINDEEAEAFAGRIKTTQQILDEYQEIDLSEMLLIEGTNTGQIINQDMDSDVDIMFPDNWQESVKGNAFLELTLLPTETGNIKIFYDTGTGYYEEQSDLITCTESTECQIRYALPTDIKSIRITFSSIPSKLTDLKVMDSTEPIKNSDNPSVLYEGKNSAHIYGSITCDRNGVLYIPLTYSKNWKVSIDGQKSETYVGNSGFLAVNITQGEHTVEIDYKPIEFKIGILCFVIAIFMTILYYRIYKYLRNKAEKNAFSSKEQR